MTIILPRLRETQPIEVQEESLRLDELYSLSLLDSATDQRFDQYVRLASTVLGAPLAAISLVDEHRQWFKSRVGFDIAETPRDWSFCAHAIAEPELLVIPDAREDPRFAANPFVVGAPFIRSYAGAVIRGPIGQPIGTLCVLDTEPRSLRERDRSALIQIARMVDAEFRHAHRATVVADKAHAVVLLDNVTGLPKLALFRTMLRDAILATDERTPVLLLALVKVERFDSLDAALGHDAAMYVMGILAARIRNVLGAECAIGLVREDQVGVAVALPRNLAAVAVLDRMLGCVRQPFDIAGHSIPLRVGIGAASYPGHADGEEALLKRARTALWSRPLSADSGYCLYQRRHSDWASDRFRIEAAVRHGLEHGEFELVYQPKIDLARHAIVGAEALLRWNSESLGPVAPARFIPIVEESGLIAELGAWVLDAACDAMARWQRLGIECPEIAVNVTSYQLRQIDFCRHVEESLRKHGIAGERINLELTERTLVDDIEGAVRIMHELCKLGVSFAVDDFGTGFSSLSYLRSMPIQTLKIDRSFIANVPNDEDDMKLVRSIVSMSHDLELDVVAEGVETQAQLAFLRAIGCDCVQGYVFSPPLGAVEFESFAKLYDNRWSASGMVAL